MIGNATEPKPLRRTMFLAEVIELWVDLADARHGMLMPAL